MFAFASDRPRRRPSLTPMIDVVFLLLVFFMLAARFGQDTAIPLTAGTGTAAWDGPPRLIELTETGPLLNGVAIQTDALPDALAGLLPKPQAPVLLRATDAVDLSALTALIDLLSAAGVTNLVLVE